MVDESEYNGETLELVMTNADPRSAPLIAQVVKQSFEEIGVDSKIQIVGGSSYNDRKANGRGHLFADTVHLNFAGEFFTTLRKFGSASGEGQFEELDTDEPANQPRKEVRDRLDPLFEKARTTTDREVRKNALVKAQQIIMEEALRLPLFHPKYIVGMRTSIEGVDWHPIHPMTRTENLKYFK